MQTAHLFGKLIIVFTSYKFLSVSPIDRDTESDSAQFEIRSQCYFSE